MCILDQLASGCRKLLSEIGPKEDSPPKTTTSRLVQLPVVCMENANLSANTWRALVKPEKA